MSPSYAVSEIIPLRRISLGDTATVAGAPESTVISPEVPETIKKKMTSKKKKPAIGEMFNNVGKIRIKPYLDERHSNMGLENYGYAVFPGTYHEEQLAAIERNGVVRYITGFPRTNSSEIDSLLFTIPEVKLQNIP